MTQDVGSNSNLEEMFDKYNETRFSRVPPSSLEDNIHLIPRASRAFRDALCSSDEEAPEIAARPRSNTYDSSYRQRKPQLSVHFSQELVSDICSSTESIVISKPRKLTSILIRRQNEVPEETKPDDSGWSSQEDNVEPSLCALTEGRPRPVYSPTPIVERTDSQTIVSDSNSNPDDDTCSSAETGRAKKKKRHKNVFDRLAIPKERDSRFRPLRPRSSTMFNRTQSLDPVPTLKSKLKTSVRH